MIALENMQEYQREIDAAIYSIIQARCCLGLDGVDGDVELTDEVKGEFVEIEFALRRLQEPEWFVRAWELAIIKERQEKETKKEE